MSNLDDKLLGEKNHYYCSSSSDDDGDDNDDDEYNNNNNSHVQNDSSISVQSKIKWEGTSCNTGPKGVIEDFQRYKKFENEKRANRERKRMEKIKKSVLTVTSMPSSQSVPAKTLPPDQLDELEDDENDPFINEYIAKRMKEMLELHNQQRSLTMNKFGQLKHLTNGEMFLKYIDDVKLRTVLIITHIYNHKIIECNTMNNCLDKLAKKYTNVLFCSLDGINVGMSREFTKYGVPALLVYKNGELIGNFVSLGDEFGTDFDENDVEDFLVENNILISSQLISSISVTSNLSKQFEQQSLNK